MGITNPPNARPGTPILPTETTMNARRWIFLSAPAVFLAGCSDTITTPEAPLSAYGLSAHLDHTWVEGNTVQGHHAPDVETTVLDDRVQLCATWTDFSNFDPEDPDVYSFDVELHDGEEWVKLGSAGGSGSSHEDVCFTTGPMDPGTYDFRVKGMALVPTNGNPPSSPHHTLFWEGQVTVGVEFRFEAYLRLPPGSWVESEAFNRQAGTWNFQFMLKVWDADAEDFLPVLSCDDFPPAEVGVTLAWDEPSEDTRDAGYTGDECSYVGAVGAAVYEATVENAFQRQDSSGEIVFIINGVENENQVTFTSD
jgi:hypothetical protein